MTETRPYPQRARDRIASTKIIDRLVKHVMGEIELTPAQVASARLLLSKAPPDMKSIEVDVHAELKTVPYHRLTDAQLMAIASGAINGQGLPEAIDGECEAFQDPLKRGEDQEIMVRMLVRYKSAFENVHILKHVIPCLQVQIVMCVLQEVSRGR